MTTGLRPVKNLNSKNCRSQEAKILPWFSLPHGGTVTNPMFFLSLHLYNGDTLPDSQMKMRKKTEDV